MKITPEVSNTSEARRLSYMPIGDQLDAIMKLASFLQEAKMDLPKEVTAWIAHCKGVKDSFPKP